jgi:hypothetical protein
VTEKFTGKQKYILFNPQIKYQIKIKNNKKKLYVSLNVTIFYLMH